MPSSIESNNVNLKPLIKQILFYYIKQKQFKQHILSVFNKHFEMVPYSEKNNKVRRSTFYRIMKNELRRGFAATSNEFSFLKDILDQHGVVVVKIEGIKYYKGLRLRVSNQSL